MKWGVIRFPGSNCDLDCLYVCQDLLRVKAELVDYRQTDLANYDCIILPGGFSYGDYVRAGAMAKLSPSLDALREFAEKGRPVLGICNGFQILLEAGLLPGAMLPNEHLEFRCEWVYLKCENKSTPFTEKCTDLLKMPIAHAVGNYFIPPDGLKALEENGQIVFRYCDMQGNITKEANPNGSVGNIAGIVNRRGNVLGMMPHPERASEQCLASTDGRRIFNSLLESLQYAKV